MEKQTLNVNCEIKSIDEQSMKFVAYGSTFDVDLVNDRIEKGAYTKVIEKAKRSGKQLNLQPVFWAVKSWRKGFKI